MGEWVEITLGKVCSKIGSGATPRGGSSVYLEKGPYALIRSQNVHNDGFRCEGLAFISEAHAAELANVEVLEGDVLLNITGDSVARACQVDPSVLPARVNQHVAIIRPDPARLDSRFLLYCLISPRMQERLLAWAASRTTRNALTKAMIESITIIAPSDVRQQRAIADVLGTLDDKIEVNRRMSETLEEMARALFESWFVRFDPVRAKMEGRDPGLPPDLAALFPDRLVDSELGEVPAGWEIGTFGAIIKERTERVAGRQAVVLSAVSSGKLVPSEEFFNKRVHSRDISRYLLVEQGDFAYNPARINIGSIGMLQDDVVGAVSPVYVVFRPRKEFGWFLEFSLRRASVRAWIETLASGSVRQTLSYRDFASIPCVIPPVQLVEEFNKRWLTLREGIRSRDAESRTLAEIRDTLLPKLISGELRVKDAERLVAAAT